MDPTWSNVPQRKRRRPALACERCRQRKIKCDRSMPCDQCVRTDSEPCTYVPDDRVTKIHRPEPKQTPCPPLPSARAENGGRSAHQPHPPTPAVSVTGTGSSSIDMDMVLPTFDLDADPFPLLLPDSTDATDILSRRPRLSVGLASESGGEELYTPSTVQALLQRMQQLEARLSQSQSQLQLQTVENAENQTTISTPTQTPTQTPAQKQHRAPVSKDQLKGTFVKSRFYAQNHWRASINQVRDSSFPLPGLHLLMEPMNAV